MTRLDSLECAAPVDDRSRARLTGHGLQKAIGVVGTVLLLSGCSSPVRPGPVIDPAAPAPFATTGGPAPTQAQAQAAVDAAIRGNGLSGVFPRFGALEPDPVPTRITLFACGQAGADAMARRRIATGVSTTCHVDVLDQNDGLVGRTTMRFARPQGAWVLVEDREREFDAR